MLALWFVRFIVLSQCSTARGTDLLLPIRHAPDPAALIRFAREGGYQIVGVQQTPRSVPYHQADYPPRPPFVLGAEDDGLQLMKPAKGLPTRQ